MNVILKDPKSKFKLFIEFINKYFTQILFTPLLIGGIIQVANLFIISPQYIRFFSPTQAIADGILCLLFMIIMLFSFLVLMLGGFVGAADKLKKKIENPEQVEMERKKQYEMQQTKGHKAAFIIFGCLAIFCYYFISTRVFYKSPAQSFDTGKIIAFGLMLFSFNMGIVISIVGVFSQYTYFFIRKEYQKPLLVTLIGVNFITFLVMMTITNSQNSALNFKVLQEKYRCKSDKKSYCKVIYFNDRYIFIERKCSTKPKEIIIDKFDSLFDSIPVK